MVGHHLTWWDLRLSYTELPSYLTALTLAMLNNPPELRLVTDGFRDHTSVYMVYLALLLGSLQHTVSAHW